MGEKMATRRRKLEFTISRFKGFWKEYKRSKKGIFGIIILVFFVIMALAAPLLTPYDPITPMRNVGEYPAYGTGKGPKIAETLCYPAWYKYLPWVHKGYVQRQETFHNLIRNVTGMIPPLVQLFGLQGKNATDTNIVLSNPCLNVTKVKVEMQNGTSKELVQNEEWSWSEMNPRVVNILAFFPNETNFIVSYYGGEDIVENMDIVQDFKFSKKSSLAEWNYSGDKTVKVNYNPANGTENDGCLEITFSQNKSATIQILKTFNYSGLVPPKSFIAHLSLKVVGNPCDVNLIFYRVLENGSLTKPFYIARFNAIGNYSENQKFGLVISDSDKVRKLIGSAYGVNYELYPADFIFRHPGKYEFGVEINSKNETKVFIDNFNCILYGNAFGILGTDDTPEYPRDLFSALVYGSRVSLFVGILTAVLSTLIGLVAGLTSGYVGGIVDEAVMRVADLLLVLPTLPLFIVLAAVMKSTYGLVSIWNIIIILTLFGWMGFARTVRSMALSIKERPFIEAAKASGASTSYIIFRHIVPNVFALVYVTLAMSVPSAIITEASLSWLGLGDPMVASWGKTLYDFNVSGVALTKGLTEYWFWIFPPCIAIMLLSMSFILIGFALDEILNPRLRLRR